jgi:trans-aconitate methyltransferase
MESPAVGQRPVLRRLLGDAIMVQHPQSLLVLGCSDGDGLEHVDPLVTTQVTCVDINPAYLERLRSRFPHPAYALTLQCADVAELALEPASFDLVHAALLFEYVAWPIVLPRLVSALRPHGTLSIVLQLPSLTEPAVTPTPFASLRQLEGIFQFVDPNDLLRRAATLGLAVQSRRTEALPAGKAFEVLHFSLVAV